MRFVFALLTSSLVCGVAPAASAVSEHPHALVDASSTTLPGHWFGLRLSYAPTLTTMHSARSASNEALGGLTNGDASLFGAAHGAQIGFVYATPWGIRGQLGVAGLYDRGSADVALPVIDPKSNTIIRTEQTVVTGHAWAVTVPILVGYEYEVVRSLYVNADTGIEIIPIAGLNYSNEFLDSPGTVTGGTTVGWIASLGASWRPMANLGVNLAVTYRRASTETLVMVDDQSVLAETPRGRAVNLDFSGFGLQFGVTGFFLGGSADRPAAATSTPVADPHEVLPSPAKDPTPEEDPVGDDWL